MGFWFFFGRQIEVFSKFVFSFQFYLIDENPKRCHLTNWMGQISAWSKPWTLKNQGKDTISAPNAEMLALKFNCFIKIMSKTFFPVREIWVLWQKIYIIYELVSIFISSVVWHSVANITFPLQFSKEIAVTHGNSSVTQFLVIPSFAILVRHWIEICQVNFYHRIRNRICEIACLHAVERHLSATPKCQSIVVKRQQKCVRLKSSTWAQSWSVQNLKLH